MPLYSYHGLSEDGEPVADERMATSRQSLSDELERQGILVQKIRKKTSARSFFKKQLNLKILLVFIHEFSVMLRSGMSIHESLKLITEEQEFPELELALKSVLNDVRSGVEFSDACALFPNIFDPLFIRTVKVGEKSGDIVHALNGYHQFLKQKIKLKKKISQAMTYPVFLLVAMTAIVGVLLLFVMPRFIGLYSEFDAQLPFLTGLLIKVVDQIYIFAPLGLIVLTSGIVGYRLFCATTAGRLWNDHLKLRLPFVGVVYSHAMIAQSARMLGALVAAGTPLVEALKSTSTGITNSVYAHRLEQSAVYVSEGNSLAHAFQKTDIFPAIAQRMVRAGEKSGSLDDMLSVVAEFYEESVSDKLERLISLVEPVLILLMGSFIGGVIVVMYLPIIHMADIIR